MGLGVGRGGARGLGKGLGMAGGQGGGWVELGGGRGWGVRLGVAGGGVDVRLLCQRRVASKRVLGKRHAHSQRMMSVLFSCECPLGVRCFHVFSFPWFSFCAVRGNCSCCYCPFLLGLDLGIAVITDPVAIATVDFLFLVSLQASFLTLFSPLMLFFVLRRPLPVLYSRSFLFAHLRRLPSCAPSLTR